MQLDHELKGRLEQEYRNRTKQKNELLKQVRAIDDELTKIGALLGKSERKPFGYFTDIVVETLKAHGKVKRPQQITDLLFAVHSRGDNRSVFGTKVASILSRKAAENNSPVCRNEDGSYEYVEVNG